MRRELLSEVVALAAGRRRSSSDSTHELLDGLKFDTLLYRVRQTLTRMLFRHMPMRQFGISFSVGRDRDESQPAFETRSDFG